MLDDRFEREGLAALGGRDEGGRVDHVDLAVEHGECADGQPVFLAIVIAPRSASCQLPGAREIVESNGTYNNR